MTVRVAVSVEGPTEREFVKNVLRPHLNARAVYLSPVPLDGNVSLDKAERDLRRLLHNHDAVTTLYDFYGFRRRDALTVDELEQALAERIGNPANFIPYIQLHEFEALIFAGPDEAAKVLGIPALAAELHRIVEDCGAPERINDGYDTCPSRRLKRLRPSYDKVLHGHLIVERIGLARVRDACPRFGAWLSRLEALARG